MKRKIYNLTLLVFILFLFWSCSFVDKPKNDNNTNYRYLYEEDLGGFSSLSVVITSYDEFTSYSNKDSLNSTYDINYFEKNNLFLFFYNYRPECETDIRLLKFTQLSPTNNDERQTMLLDIGYRNISGTDFSQIHFHTTLFIPPIPIEVSLNKNIELNFNLGILVINDGEEPKYKSEFYDCLPIDYKYLYYENNRNDFEVFNKTEDFKKSQYFYYVENEEIYNDDFFNNNDLLIFNFKSLYIESNLRVLKVIIPNSNKLDYQYQTIYINFGITGIVDETVFSMIYYPPIPMFIPIPKFNVPIKNVAILVINDLEEDIYRYRSAYYNCFK